MSSTDPRLLARSDEYADRARAGTLLAAEAGDEQADALLHRLLLDEQDTFVTYETATALLQRGDDTGLRLVLEAKTDADPDTSQWLYEAINTVRGADRPSLRAALAAARTADAGLDAVVAELLELFARD